MNNWPFLWAADAAGRPSGKGRFLVSDTETTGFIRVVNSPDDFHIITIEDYYTGEVFVFFDPYEKRKNPTELSQEGTQDGYIADGIRMLMEAESFSFQNAVGFDAFVIEKAFPWFKYNYRGTRVGMPNSDIFPYKLMDTMILSQLLYPDRPLDGKAYGLGMGNIGSHSIQAHGIRMGRWKPDHDDWSTLTDEMVHRNVEDTAIGRDMLRWLMEGDWVEHKRRGSNKLTGLGIHDAYIMELQLAFMITRQEQRGFRLDMARALKDYNEIDKEMQEILTAVAPHVPPRLKTKPYKFEELKSKYKAFEKSNLLKSSLSDDLDSWGMRNLIDIKSFFNEIHGCMKAKGDEGRIGDKATMWDITTKSGDYGKRLQGYFPEMRGNINDTKDPLVCGAFTPIEFEDIGLGNLDYIKELVLHPVGWVGVNYSDSEQAWIDEWGEPRYPWSGKIDEDSLKAWKLRQDVPEWAEKIAKYYILRSRRSQILNSGDVEKFLEKGEWPRQASGRNECRGLMAVAYCKEYNMTAGEYFAKMGTWPTSVDEEWRVPAAAFSIGTNTFRMRHKFVVNIPSRGLRPLRHLFIASNGYSILGCDGAGLELRMLAHFMADAVYQEIVLHGDIHTHNMLKAGLPKRDTAKTFIYAFLYGSGAANLARVAGMTPRQMEECIAKFKAELPALARLIERCEEAGRKFGYLQSVDGRWGRIRKKQGKVLVHTVLNVLLQMTGSLTMRYGACFAEDEMIAQGVGLDAAGWPAFVANQHDEIQMEVKTDEVQHLDYVLPWPDSGVTDYDSYAGAFKQLWDGDEKRKHVDDAGRCWSAPSITSVGVDGITCSRKYHPAGGILVDSFIKAGEHLKLRCPLDGEYKIGASWHDTH
ncbi:MAG: hypothetical protein [Caudoviricetes sp.]|nr:MAG: hypothetical protein [Caudoviricetes sp.]